MIRHLFWVVGLLYGGARAEQVLMDFETLGDVHSWTSESGHIQHHTSGQLHGKGALEIEIGTKMHTALLPRDWSGHTAFEFDVMNPLDAPVSLLIVLGDRPWLETKSYWNQHNRSLLIPKGKSTITIPLDDLYRGTSDQPFMDNQTPLDLTRMVYVEMEFKGLPGNLLMDDIRLTGSKDTPRAKNPESRETKPKTQESQTVVAPVQTQNPDNASSTQGSLVLCDFETVRDQYLWEKRRGWFTPEVVEENVASGNQSLKVGVQSLLVSTGLKPNWQGYDQLSISVYNDTESVVPCTITIGDGAWQAQQHYYNRYNGFFRTIPGENTITIPLKDLYRGEPQRRNTMIPRNLDLNNIRQMNIEIGGENGFVYVDRIVLEGDSGSVPANAQPATPKPPVVPPVVTTAGTTTPPKSPEPSVVKDTWILNSFESPREVFSANKRSGWFTPEAVKEHATEGEQSLKLGQQSLLVFETLPTDWRGYQSLEFDLFLEGDVVVPIEIMIGDRAWAAQQNYYNRHNRMVRLIPGQNTVSIPLSDLYRGENAKRNTWIPRNIDLDSILQLNLKIFGDGSGMLYLDALRLKGGNSEGQTDATKNLNTQSKLSKSEGALKKKVLYLTSHGMISKS